MDITKIEQVAAEIHEVVTESADEILAHGDYPAWMRPIITMQDLYDVDKMGYVVYRTIFHLGRRSTTTPVMIAMDELAATVTESEQGFPITPDEVQDVVYGLAERIVTLETEGDGRFSFPVLSIEAVATVNGRTSITVASHGALGVVMASLARASHMSLTMTPEEISEAVGW